MTLVLAYSAAGTPSGKPTLDEAVAGLQRDLFDGFVAGNTTAALPRWSDDDLVRALHRALDRYSVVSPLIATAATASLPRTRAYGLPPDAWWIESVEFPSGLYPRHEVAFREIVTPSLGLPASAPTASPALTGGPLTGSYRWSATFVKSGGETLLGPASPPLTLAGDAALLDGLPLGPPGTVGRRVYRSGPAPDAPAVLAGQVLDNTTQRWLDETPDARRGGPPPAVDTTADLRQVELALAPDHLPVDANGVVTLTYAAPHVLTLAGTTVPEQRRAVLQEGAIAYALLAYGVPTNDAFTYQDGAMHDRVDEHTVPRAWAAAGAAALARFEALLAAVGRERDAGLAAVAHWGAVPAHWSRI